METVDLEARERIAKIWTSLRELATVLWGDDKTRDNGLRSRVDALEAFRLESEIDRSYLHKKLQHYLDVERQETCHGIKALEAHETKLLKKAGEETDVRIAKIQASAQMKTAGWQTYAILIGVFAQIALAIVTKIWP